MRNVLKKIFNWLATHKLLVLVFAIVASILYSFTYSGRCLIARGEVEYYARALEVKDFRDLPFDTSTCPVLDENAALLATTHITHLGVLEMSGETITKLVDMGPGVVPFLLTP